MKGNESEMINVKRRDYLIVSLFKATKEDILINLSL